MARSSAGDDTSARLGDVHPLLLAALPGLADAVVPPAALSRDRSRLDPDEVIASQRWRLLLASARTMAADGYAATTIEKVTNEAGVSKKTFYKCFASKEDAFLACYDAIEPALGFVVDAARGHDTLEATVRAMVSTYLATLAAAPALTRLFLIEALTASPKIRARRSVTIDRLADAVGDLVDGPRSRGWGVAPMGRPQLIGLLGGVNELCVELLSRDEPASLPSLEEVITEFVLRVLGTSLVSPTS
jgi:AcrR family transcriptional regulator